jgi:diketogulonate reductase-like aldo/keto reductase
MDQLMYDSGVATGMEELVVKGLARNIGVSNFVAQSVMDLLKYARIKPAVNQVELHPYLVQESLVWFCQKEGVQVRRC